ncbi:MAG: pseudouridine synthase [Sandaracinaceae bacterium]
MPQSLAGAAHLYRVDELYRDEWLVVVNKPSGVAVHRGWAADPVNMVKLVRRLVRHWVAPVHRLDRGTSGALVFALDGETAGLLQDLFREQVVAKRYIALARGVTDVDGRIDHPVPRSLDGPRVDAVTSYRRLAVARDRYSLVEAFPKSGRLHQIRRHFKHLSHPLIGDTRYGDGRVNRHLREEAGLLRLALHAAGIRFDHPRTGRPIQIVAPPPDDLRVPLERLGLAAPDWAPEKQ